jgi:hypothetical protein
MEITIDHLIGVCDKLCNTLSVMANNERKFGFELCHRIELLSYDIYKSLQELREINEYTTFDEERRVI